MSRDKLERFLLSARDKDKQGDGSAGVRASRLLDGGADLQLVVEVVGQRCLDLLHGLAVALLLLHGQRPTACHRGGQSAQAGHVSSMSPCHEKERRSDETHPASTASIWVIIGPHSCRAMFAQLDKHCGEKVHETGAKERPRAVTCHDALYLLVGLLCALRRPLGPLDHRGQQAGVSFVGSAACRHKSCQSDRMQLQSL